MKTYQLPPVGTLVTVDDPLGYGGTGIVTGGQETPHLAVEVRMLTITDRTDQSVRGRKVWILAGYVTVEK